MMAKYTTGFLVIGIVVGVLLTKIRQHFAKQMALDWCGFVSAGLDPCRLGYGMSRVGVVLTVSQP
jgi:hypothetical protein